MADGKGAYRQGALDHEGIKHVAFIQADHDALANPHHSNANDHAQAHSLSGADHTGALVESQTPLTTKGDILVTDGTTLQRVAIGTDTQALVADSAQVNGLKWATITHSKSITVESPTGTEDLSIFFTNQAITITEMRAVLVGSATPSVTWTIRHNADRSAAGTEVVTSGTTTTSTTTGSDVTSFNDATVVADAFVWLETTAKSGTVTELHITIVYTVD